MDKGLEDEVVVVNLLGVGLDALEDSDETEDREDDGLEDKGREGALGNMEGHANLERTLPKKQKLKAIPRAEYYLMVILI